MDFLTKEQILEADDLPTRDVEVPEWGGKVRVRSMTANERDRWENKMFADGKTADVIRANLVGLCAIDPNTGERMFKDVELLDLGNKSALAMQRVFDAASELNGLSKSDVDDLEKGSGANQADAGSSK